MAVIISHHAEDYRGGLDSPGGLGWEVDGQYYATNPAHSLPTNYADMLRLWRMTQGADGAYTGVWPDTGGIYDQAAIMIEAFAIMRGVDAELRLEDLERRKRQR